MDPLCAESSCGDDRPFPIDIRGPSARFDWFRTELVHFFLVLFAGRVAEFLEFGGGHALSAADGFLQQVVPTITTLAAYRERGLIVITFGSVGSATASGLPAGAATATASSTPPSGILLLSPFARAGAKSSTAFNPASPKQSLEKLLHK
jgi:hypothetical protein